MRRNRITANCVCAIPIMLTAGCATQSSSFPNTIVEDTAMVSADGRIEVGVTESGDITECEFHIPRSRVPERVIEAVNRQFPGGEITDCEKEHVGGTVYYEVTKMIEGRKCEVMCTTDGNIYRMEKAIAESEAPAAVLSATDRAVPGGRRTMVETILDADEKLLEYHVKKDVDGKHYKVVVGTDHAVDTVYREVAAEIEVPVK